MNLSHNETMSIRQKMSDVHLLMVPTNAMHRNGAYNCALPYGGNRKFHLLDKLEFIYLVNLHL